MFVSSVKFLYWFPTGKVSFFKKKQQLETTGTQRFTDAAAQEEERHASNQEDCDPGRKPIVLLLQARKDGNRTRTLLGRFRKREVRGLIPPVQTGI